jgi:hypothetical protein
MKVGVKASHRSLFAVTEHCGQLEGGTLPGLALLYYSMGRRWAVIQGNICRSIFD